MTRHLLLKLVAAAFALAVVAAPLPSRAEDDKPKEDPKKVQPKDDLDDLDDLDQASEDLTGQAKTKKDDRQSDLDEASRKLRGEEEGEEGANEDPIAILQKVRDKMMEAADSLSKAGNWKANEKQMEAIRELEKLLKENESNSQQSGSSGGSGGGSSSSSSGGGSESAGGGGTGGAGGSQGEAAKGMDEAIRQALEAQGKSKEQIEQMMGESAGKMKEAQREIEKIMKECDKGMQGALDNIEKLIKMAKVVEVQGEGEQGQKKPKPKDGKQTQPKNPNNDENSHDPAQKPYDPEKKNPPDLPESRLPKPPSKKWGDLPDRIREEILQHRTNDQVPYYKDLLERYFKILSGEE